MDPLTLRIELSDVSIQELVWKALNPDGLVMMHYFNKSFEQAQEQLGQALENMQITGVSATIEDGRVFAEITYTPVSNEQNA